jgi:hypothetical protein
MCPRTGEDRAGIEFQPIRVNRVEYSFSGALARSVKTGGWEMVDCFGLYRRHGEPTDNARRAVNGGLPDELAPWLDGHPHFLEEAHQVVLSNEIAKAEAEILAAKLQHRDAHRRRGELLEREAQ